MRAIGGGKNENPSDGLTNTISLVGTVVGRPVSRDSRVRTASLGRPDQKPKASNTQYNGQKQKVNNFFSFGSSQGLNSGNNSQVRTQKVHSNVM